MAEKPFTIQCGKGGTSATYARKSGRGGAWSVVYG